MAFMNYVDLKPGIPTRLHFTDWYFTVRMIQDKESGKIKPIKSLVFWVDTLEGEPVARTFSVTSQKLLALLMPFMPAHEFVNYEFLITKMGTGFYSDFNFQPIKRAVEIPLSERQLLGNPKEIIEKLWESI